jgi:hypothetical protein
MCGGWLGGWGGGLGQLRGCTKPLCTLSLPTKPLHAHFFFFNLGYMPDIHTCMQLLGSGGGLGAHRWQGWPAGEVAGGVPELFRVTLCCARARVCSVLCCAVQGTVCFAGQWLLGCAPCLAACCEQWAGGSSEMLKVPRVPQLKWAQTKRATRGGYKRWPQEVATRGGHKRWLQEVATRGGHKRWPQLGTNNKSHRV